MSTFVVIDDFNLPTLDSNWILSGSLGGPGGAIYTVDTTTNPGKLTIANGNSNVDQRVLVRDDYLLPIGGILSTEIEGGVNDLQGLALTKSTNPSDTRHILSFTVQFGVDDNVDARYRPTGGGFTSIYNQDISIVGSGIVAKLYIHRVGDRDYEFEWEDTLGAKFNVASFSIPGGEPNPTGGIGYWFDIRNSVINVRFDNFAITYPPIPKNLLMKKADGTLCKISPANLICPLIKNCISQGCTGIDAAVENLGSTVPNEPFVAYNILGDCFAIWGCVEAAETFDIIVYEQPVKLRVPLPQFPIPENKIVNLDCSTGVWSTCIPSGDLPPYNGFIPVSGKIMFDSTPLGQLDMLLCICIPDITPPPPAGYRPLFSFKTCGQFCDPVISSVPTPLSIINTNSGPEGYGTEERGLLYINESSPVTLPAGVSTGRATTFTFRTPSGGNFGGQRVQPLFAELVGPNSFIIRSIGTVRDGTVDFPGGAVDTVFTFPYLEGSTPMIQSGWVAGITSGPGSNRGVVALDMPENQGVEGWLTYQGPTGPIPSITLNMPPTPGGVVIADANMRRYLFNIEVQACQEGQNLPTAFIAVFKTDNISSGSSASNQVKLPLLSTGIYNFVINWGDGNQNTITVWNDPATTHTYAAIGTYTITIMGQLECWRFANGGDRLKLLDIRQWGSDFRLGPTDSHFYGCENMIITALDVLNLTGTISFLNTFAACKVLTDISNINDWDTSNIINMQSMFNGAILFNGNISSWDVSNVTDMSFMFAGTSFNQSISDWDVSSVENFIRMFNVNSSFDQNLSNWQTSAATNMGSMFDNCPTFNNGGVGNTGINNWDVTNVTDFGLMFNGASSFNQPIGNWNLSGNIFRMFNGASSFNQDLGSGNWDVSGNTSFEALFSGATNFNNGNTGTIKNWDVSNITNMNRTFEFTSFDQDIGNWDITSLVPPDALDNFLNGVTMSKTNYDALLSGWNTTVTTNGGPTGMDSLNGGFSQYSVVSSRQNLIDTHGWTIIDGGPCPSFISTWDTTKTTGSVTLDNQIQLPLSTFGCYDMIINWGETGATGGTTGPYNNTTVIGSTGPLTHTYGSTGIYKVTITGKCQGWRFNDLGDKNKIINIQQWGSLHLDSPNTTQGGYFLGCENLTITATDILDTTGTTSMFEAFEKCSSLTTVPNMDLWDMSNVTNMGDMFQLCTNFNQPLNGWDTSNVTGMSFMFKLCLNFNQPLSNWDVSKVVNVEAMFDNATSFDQDLSSWDVSSIQVFNNMFALCTSFNNGGSTGINNWPINTNPLQQVDMFGMFSNATSFNQPLYNWNTSRVWRTWGMFASATSFNNGETGGVTGPGLNGWDTGNVIDMRDMFNLASAFNQDITLWNTSKVTIMDGMFFNTPLFNQPLNTNPAGATGGAVISGWDVSNVTSIAGMFAFSGFDQDISNWNVSKVTNMAFTFQASSFNNAGSTGINSWNTSSLQNMFATFRNNSIFNQPIDNWDVSNVIEFGECFEVNTGFNQDLNNWNINTSSSVSMGRMFSQSNFNNGQPPGATGPGLNWDMSRVTNTSAMFRENGAFNQDISSWRMLSCVNSSAMFRNASSFNSNLSNLFTPLPGPTGPTGASIQDMTDMFADTNFNNGGETGETGPGLNSWDVSNVTNMSTVFIRNPKFNQDITLWDTSNVTNMYRTFNQATSFNQPIGVWDVSNVTNMNALFSGTNFNQPLSDWNVSNVTDFGEMFSYNTQFNQPIGSWNVSSVTTMSQSFAGATGFDQDLGATGATGVTGIGWDVFNVSDMEFMFQNVTLSTANYDSLLLYWAYLPGGVQMNVTFDGGNSQYTMSPSAAATARSILTGTYNWTITDGGPV